MIDAGSDLELPTDNKKPQYMISVIIPIYNTGQYLRETIESILVQSLGFKKNIQLILVNDGSTDDSEKICLRYSSSFPENIIYIRLPHGGVSSARNAGLEQVRGKYVTFLDSDDKWEDDAFRRALAFFESHYDETDVVSARMRFFHAVTHYHPLDYKFYRTRMVNLSEEFDCIQVSASSCFIKAEAIGSLRFSTHLQYFEDSLFINSIIINKATVGILREAVYLYRKRPDHTSATQTDLGSRNYLFDTVQYYHVALFNLSKQMYGYVVPFIQYASCYDLQYKLRRDPKPLISPSEYERYCEEFLWLLKHIDDNVILSIRLIPMNLRVFLLSKKKDTDIRTAFILQQDQIMYEDFPILNVSLGPPLVRWVSFSVKHNNLSLVGKDQVWLDSSTYSYFLSDGSYSIQPTYERKRRFDVVTTFGLAYKGRLVHFSHQLPSFRPVRLKLFFLFAEQSILAVTSTSPGIHLPILGQILFLRPLYIVLVRPAELVVIPIKILFPTILFLMLYLKYHKHYMELS